ncbi:MAG: hypothetical protein AMXMBFR53_20810 [Gemmatimonadota bacterium]
MSGHIPLDTIHDLVEGLLAAGERERVEAHVRGCSECRSAAAELSALRGDLEALPRTAVPPEGLWRGIEARIAGADPGDGSREVLPFPGVTRGARRYTLSLPQLAAAAVVVSLLSAGVVWMALAGSGAAPEGEGGAPAMMGAARMVSSGTSSYEAAAAELERVLDEGRGLLDPETVATLERSLATIDQAIAEVEDALRADPASDLLARLLVSHQGTRLRVLRQAATLVRPQI